MPAVISGVLFGDDVIKYMPCKEILDHLSGNSRTILQISFLEVAGSSAKRYVAFGMPAAIVMEELLFEARLIGYIREGEVPPFSIEDFSSPIEEIFGTSEVLILPASELKTFYRKAKSQLGRSPKGKEVFEIFSSFGVTPKSGTWSRLFSRMISERQK